MYQYAFFLFLYSFFIFIATSMLSLLFSIFKIPTCVVL